MQNLWRVLVVLVAVLALGACDKGSGEAGEPVCGVVKVAEGCKAQCSRLAPEPGKATKVCAKQLISRRDGENSILKNDIKKVRTVQLPMEVCFEVKDNAPKDPEMVKKLTAACATAE